VTSLGNNSKISSHVWYPLKQVWGHTSFEVEVGIGVVEVGSPRVVKYVIRVEGKRVVSNGARVVGSVEVVEVEVVEVVTIRCVV
jgi:hypothetical protein